MDELPPWPWKKADRERYIDWSTKFIADNLDRLQALEQGPTPQGQGVES